MAGDPTTSATSFGKADLDELLATIKALTPAWAKYRGKARLQGTDHLIPETGDAYVIDGEAGALAEPFLSIFRGRPRYTVLVHSKQLAELRLQGVPDDELAAIMCHLCFEQAAERDRRKFGGDLYQGGVITGGS